MRPNQNAIGKILSKRHNMGDDKFHPFFYFKQRG